VLRALGLALSLLLRRIGAKRRARRSIEPCSRDRVARLPRRASSLCGLAATAGRTEDLAGREAERRVGGKMHGSRLAGRYRKHEVVKVVRPTSWARCFRSARAARGERRSGDLSAGPRKRSRDESTSYRVVYVGRDRPRRYVARRPRRRAKSPAPALARAGLSLGPETWGCPEFQLQSDIFSGLIPITCRGLVNVEAGPARSGTR
jgi:hypothetical protein